MQFALTRQDLAKVLLKLGNPRECLVQAEKAIKMLHGIYGESQDQSIKEMRQLQQQALMDLGRFVYVHVG